MTGLTAITLSLSTHPVLFFIRRFAQVKDGKEVFYSGRSSGLTRLHLFLLLVCRYYNGKTIETPFFFAAQFYWMNFSLIFLLAERIGNNFFLIFCFRVQSDQISDGQNTNTIKGPKVTFG